MAGISKQQWVENVTDKEIHDALIMWLRGATSLLFIKDRQSGELPLLPYGMATMTGVVEVRTHPQDLIYERLEIGSSVCPVIETEWRFSLHVFGDDPTTVMRKLRSHFHIKQANEPLIPNLIIHEFSQIRNVPEFVNNNWEQRAQLDLFLRGLTRDGVLVDTIEQVNISTGRKRD